MTDTSVAISEIAILLSTRLPISQRVIFRNTYKGQTRIYLNIIANITSKDDKPSYSGIVMRLWEINPRSIKKEKRIEPPAAFYTNSQTRCFCAYCKPKGWPGTSYNKIDCRIKKQDQSRQQAYTVEQPLQPAPAA